MSDEIMAKFLGYLSGSIPELANVDPKRLGELWLEFKAREEVK